MVTASGGAEEALGELCTARGVPLRRIGVTEGVGADAALEVRDAFRVRLTDLRAAWSSTLPNALG
jgi:phosphoribosylformylglycinamidine synthase